LDRQCRTDRTLGIVLLRHRIAEQRHHPVAQLLGDLAAHFRDRNRSGAEISADQVAPLFSVQLRGDARRVQQIAEHYYDMTSLAGG
jgi:hypothetical protein